MTYLQFLAVGEKTLKYFQIGNYKVYYLDLKYYDFLQAYKIS